MTNFLDFTPSVSWAKVRVGYEEIYDKAAKVTTLTITSIEIMSTQYVTAYYVDGVLNVNGEAVLPLVSAAGTALVDIRATNTWYPIVKASDLSTPLTVTVQIEGSETATIELTGNTFSQFGFFNDNPNLGNGWGVNESQEIALTVGKWDAYSFWLGVALGLAGKGLPPTVQPTAYLYNGVKLPPLPEWDREAYPYAVIGKDMSFVGEYYTLTVASTPFWGSPLEDGGFYIGHGTSTLNWGVKGVYMQTQCYPGEDKIWLDEVIPGDVWGNHYDGTAWHGPIDENVAGSCICYGVFWTNTDITDTHYGYEHDGIWLAATEPIPVYE